MQKNLENDRRFFERQNRQGRDKLWGEGGGAFDK